MSSFCRHRRLEATCPVCSRKREADAAPRKPPRSRPAGGRAEPRGVRRSGAGRARSSAGSLTVRRLGRSADDGYSSELTPGLRASADARLLAEEVAFSVARLAELSGDGAPGAYGRAAALGRAGATEEGLWLAFFIACIGPLDGDGDAFAEIDGAAVDWATGELPVTGELRLGPRGAGSADAAQRALVAYRTWAARAGGQAAALAGQPAWTPERRFERAFERLAMPGLGRAQRYEYLLTAGALGLADVRAASLELLADPRDPTLAAAKVVFGIGDPLLVARRARALAEAAAVPLAALDLGLVNWSRRRGDQAQSRLTCGSAVAPDPDALELLSAALELPV